jgi:hypothetical protein
MPGLKENFDTRRTLCGLHCCPFRVTLSKAPIVEGYKLSPNDKTLEPRKVDQQVIVVSVIVIEELCVAALDKDAARHVQS